MVVVFLAEGFEEMEALVTVDVLRRAGLDVRTVGVDGTIIRGAHGIAVQADCADTALDMGEMQAVVLPGGMPGTRHLEQSAIVSRCLERAVDCGVYVCAICAAPSILGKKGWLRGRQATCFPGYEAACEGAHMTAQPVVTDGRFITAKGAGVALDFALCIVEKLVSGERAAALREELQCR